MEILSSAIESSEYLEDELELEEDLSVEELLENSSDDISRTFNSPGGTSSVNSLMQCAGKIRVLTAKEEKQVIRLAQEGDKRSRNFVVMANLKMVASLARRYRNRGLPMVDLMQEGIIGLLNAVNKFDLEKGIRFSTYGAWWVREAMTRALSNKSRTVRLPVHLNEFMTKLRRVRAELSLSLGRKPTEDELALALSVKPEKVRKALGYTQPSVSLDQPVTNGEGDECALIDLTPDEAGISFDIRGRAVLVRG